MDEEDEPNVVHSSKSQRVAIDGYPFQIEIYRLEGDREWSLEVIDMDGTSHVWDETFASDKAARTAALIALEEEGPYTFMRGNNVVPFKPS